LKFSEKLQTSINDLIIYITDSYIEYVLKGNEISKEELSNNNIDDIAKIFFLYSLDMMFSGVYPDTYQIMLQNYYESKMLSIFLSQSDNINDIRVQMLFVLYGSKLLHMGKREEYLEVANQFASNKIFDLEYYKDIMID
jgi:hypothetical protein